MFTHSAIWQAIDRMANDRGWSLPRFAVLAGLDPTALNLSKRIGRDGKPRWPGTAMVNKLLGAAQISLDDFCALMAPRPQHGADALGTILLVDDDSAFCEASATALQAAGYTVWAFGDHRAALDLLD